MADQQEWTVSEKDHGENLLSFIAAQLPTVSKKAIKRAIDEGLLFVNRVSIRRSSFTLSKGDLLTLYQIFTAKRRLPFSYLYEDEYLIFISKPSGVLSSECDIEKVTGIQSPYLVHRLDKETSGVFIIAKNAKVQQAIEELFRKKEIKKSYLAIVTGSLPLKSGSIRTPLVIEKSGDKKEAFVRIAGARDEKRMEARTDWEVLLSSQNGSLLKLYPMTGRTHQIRVHLSSIGHPILGEKKYTNSASFLCRRHMLHAFAVEMIHPITKKRVVVYDPIPTDVSSLIHKLFGTAGETIACELS